MRQYNPNDDVEYAQVYGAKSERQVLGESTCPVLGGVVHSAWGALSAGAVIAGVAAGAESQQVPISELSRSALTDYSNMLVTSIFPATLSGMEGIIYSNCNENKFRISNSNITFLYHALK